MQTLFLISRVHLADQIGKSGLPGTSSFLGRPSAVYDAHLLLVVAVNRNRAAGYDFLDARQVLTGKCCICRGGGSGRTEENGAGRTSAFVRRVTHSDTF